MVHWNIFVIIETLDRAFDEADDGEISSNAHDNVDVAGNGDNSGENSIAIIMTDYIQATFFL